MSLLLKQCPAPYINFYRNKILYCLCEDNKPFTNQIITLKLKLFFGIEFDNETAKVLNLCFIRIHNILEVVI